MVGIARLLKHEVQQKDREIKKLKSRGDTAVVAVGQEESKDNPVKANVSVAAVRSVKSGAVIVKCNSRRDAEKLKTAVEASRKLKGKELEKANPRVILGRIDKDLTQDKLMRVIARNNGDLVEVCGGVKRFENQVREELRIGGKRKITILI
ncbi:hypothetical protein ILUMI_24496 [Ignelater luminosus]|uniref:Uncharacterized protein n=1 Tax=Ignelater luminosus TaxID=2038154 RepID=A0A8K0G0W6_IGNLU|nr:hypothetical protein ILUMI_24496 [Ignelater luminosus]